MQSQKSHLACGLELKSLDPSGRFAGYASVFNVVDSQRDIMLRGAFADSIRGRAAEVKLLWQHQQDEPIGSITALFEDERGLYVEGQLLLDVQRAREAFALLKAGVISGLSIGYTPRRYEVDPDTGVRALAAVDLWEISLVTFPANAAANVTVVKETQLSLRAKRSNPENQQLDCFVAIAPRNDGLTIQMTGLSAALDKAIAILALSSPL